MPQLKPICPYCTSSDITIDATAKWDMKKQDWVVSSTFDSGYCNQCDSESKRFIMKEVYQNDVDN